MNSQPTSSQSQASAGGARQATAETTAASPPANGQHDAPAWHARAEALADWTMERLVVRTDCYGGYSAEGGEVATTTIKQRLTRARLVRHFEARGTADVVGLHTTVSRKVEGLPAGRDRVSLVRYVCPELDQHGDDQAAGAANLKAALAWYDRAVSFGFHPLLIDSNGKGGYKLFILFDDAILASTARCFGLWLTRDWAELGLRKPAEVFPKQSEIAPPGSGRGSYGGWLRPPGRHAKREHWSMAWDGDAWLAGADAVDLILNTTGDPAALIPNEALAFMRDAKGARLTDSEDPREPLSAEEIKGVAADAKKALGYLKPGVTDERGREFLSDYDAWLRVGMALHELGDVGLKLWDEWSRQDASYQDGVCALKWTTFTNGAGGVTLASLIYHARRNGWADPRPVFGKKKTSRASAAGGTQANEAKDDPHRLARIFLKTHRLEGKLTLRFHCGQWLRWADAGYLRTPESDIQAIGTRSIKEEFSRLNQLAIMFWEKENAPGPSNATSQQNPTQA
jgi:hypothetical protein